MKFIAALLLLNMSFAIAEEICDESRGSLMTLSEDVISADSKMQMSELKKWYKQKTSKEEAEMYSMAPRMIADYNSGQNCDQKLFMGIPYNYCTFENGNVKMIDRKDVPLKEGEKKSSNKFLAQVFSKKDGQIIRVDRQRSTNGSEIFTVQKLLKNGEQMIYVIDPKINPGNNPVEITNVNQKKKEYIQFQHGTFGTVYTGTF